jgi:transaldolase / glucose-6-phosphate isomerase
MANPLLEVRKLGQSIWYDNIRRGLITSGELAAMIEEDGLEGVTSNPAIFEKAIAGSPDYDDALRKLVEGGVGTAHELFERLAIEDIQLAADALRAVHEKSGGRDGYVSFEVSPYLAHDTERTIEEARRLRKAIGRDNVMIKVPATPEGIPAIEKLIGEGININVTLLFSVEVYEAVANAYMAGLQALAAAGGRVDKVASVASFFVSRIDSLIDERLSEALDSTREAGRRARFKSLVGKVAIANARIAYARYQELCATAAWKRLAGKGARVQRLLWASTSTKNPKYPKTLYVDELIGPDTVNTLPAETFDEFRASGRARPSLTENWAGNLEQSREIMRTLDQVGISMVEATGALLADGVKKFSEAFDKLLGAVEKKRRALLAGALTSQTYALGGADKEVQAGLKEWREKGNLRRLWQGDESLWTGADEDRWLGWLHVVDGRRDHQEHLQYLREDVRRGGFTHALLLGMGGSSLCPEVMSETFGKSAGFPELLVLDSTVPAEVAAVERKMDLGRTLFIVSSKSGGTTETQVFKQFFFAEVAKLIGKEKAGSRFIAITDPGTKLHNLAKSDRFRHIAHGEPSIGGRYSALSNFGMVPAAIMGINVPDFLDRAEIMVHSCASCVPPEANPGVALGMALGVLGLRGVDKVTFVASPRISSLSGWLEQLIAESTGKQGRGLVPIAGEEIGPPEVYGKDRLFVYLRLNEGADAAQDKAMAAIESAGYPVVRIGLEHAMDLGQEFFRWEIATAVAGAVLGINPFDQPDVEASKIATRKLTEAYERTGEVAAENPIASDSNLSLHADPNNGGAIGAGGAKDVEGLLTAHLRRIGASDYFALNAYLPMSEENRRSLQAIRHRVRDAKRVATTLGFGPRFLHSTGQLHKGGPNSGVFLQITAEDAEDLPIPGQKYTFGILKRFQAQGDFEVLAARGRRLLRVHLGADPAAGLRGLDEMIGKALG